MKTLLTLFISLITFIGCKKSISDQTQTAPKNQLVINKEIVSHEKIAETNISIKDSSGYSKHFLNTLKETNNLGHISLIDNMLILNNKDTAYFPTYPLLGKKTVLTAKKEELAIALTVERINQTTISYRLEMIEFGHASFKEEGKAIITPQFYIGSETDENVLTGNTYPSYQYENTEGNCYTHIRIGKEARVNFLLAKIIKNCNGKLKDIDLDNFNTLIEK